MSVYWSSTKSPTHLFKRVYEGSDVAGQLVDNSFVDAAILSADLRVPHMNRMAVAAYQRRLGVRPLAVNR